MNLDTERDCAHQQSELEDMPDHEDDFDALMEGSSIGTPVALARQAQTPPEVHRMFAEHLAGLRGPDTQPCDVDDFVYDLVQSFDERHDLEADFDAQITAANRVWLVFEAKTRSPRGGLDWAFDAFMVSWLKGTTRSRYEAQHRSARLLKSLVEHDAVAGMRPDVADRIVRMVFTMSQPPSFVLETCLLILESDSVAERLITEGLRLWQPAKLSKDPAAWPVKAPTPFPAQPLTWAQQPLIKQCCRPTAGWTLGPSPALPMLLPAPVPQALPARIGDTSTTPATPPLDHQPSAEEEIRRPPSAKPPERRHAPQPIDRDGVQPVRGGIHVSAVVAVLGTIPLLLLSAILMLL